MFLLKNIFLILLFFLPLYTYSITTLYASSLGCAATIPVTDPTGTVVVLDVNLTISPTCPLTLTGNAGNLTFTATGNQQLIIAQSAQWNIAALQTPNSLNFTGNAQLVLMPGAQMLADQIIGAALNFQDSTIMSVVP